MEERDKFLRSQSAEVIQTQKISKEPPPKKKKKTKRGLEKDLSSLEEPKVTKKHPKKPRESTTDPLSSKHSRSPPPSSPSPTLSRPKHSRTPPPTSVSHENRSPPSLREDLSPIPIMLDLGDGGGEGGEEEKERKREYVSPFAGWEGEDRERGDRGSSTNLFDEKKLLTNDKREKRKKTIGSLFAKKGTQGHQEITLLIQNGQKSEVHSLLKKDSKAVTKVVDDVGSLPIHIAVTTQHQDIVQLLLKAKSPLDQANYHGYTPLHLALLSGNLENALMLVESGANCLNKTPTKQYPLHLLAGVCCEDPISYYKLTQLMYAKGAQVNEVDPDGNTAVHVSTKVNNSQGLLIFSNMGGGLNILNNAMETPLELALACGSVEAAVLLIDLKANYEKIEKMEDLPIEVEQAITKRKLEEKKIDEKAISSQKSQYLRNISKGAMKTLHMQLKQAMDENPTSNLLTSSNTLILKSPGLSQQHHISRPLPLSMSAQAEAGYGGGGSREEPGVETAISAPLNPKPANHRKASLRTTLKRRKSILEEDAVKKESLCTASSIPLDLSRKSPEQAKELINFREMLSCPIEPRDISSPSLLASQITISISSSSPSPLSPDGSASSSVLHLPFEAFSPSASFFCLGDVEEGWERCQFDIDCFFPEGEFCAGLKEVHVKEYPTCESTDLKEKLQNKGFSVNESQIDWLNHLSEQTTSNGSQPKEGIMQPAVFQAASFLDSLFTLEPPPPSRKQQKKQKSSANLHPKEPKNHTKQFPISSTTNLEMGAFSQVWKGIEGEQRKRRGEEGGEGGMKVVDWESFVGWLGEEGVREGDEEMFRNGGKKKVKRGEGRGPICRCPIASYSCTSAFSSTTPSSSSLTLQEMSGFFSNNFSLYQPCYNELSSLSHSLSQVSSQKNTSRQKLMSNLIYLKQIQNLMGEIEREVKEQMDGTRHQLKKVDQLLENEEGGGREEGGLGFDGEEEMGFEIQDEEEEEEWEVSGFSYSKA